MDQDGSDHPYASHPARTAGSAGCLDVDILGILKAMSASSQSSGVLLSVVIPAYNEEQRIAPTLTDVSRYLSRQFYRSELLVVDDGSNDRTDEVVRKVIAANPPTLDRGLVRFELLEYPDRKNRGKGAAVRTGMLAGTGKFRVFMDADNSTTIDHVEQFMPLLREKGVDVVVGSRDIDGADIAVHQPWYREVAGNLGNVLIRVVAVPGIYDTQAGFKLFTAVCAEDVFPRLTVNRWGFDVETLAVARHRGFTILEAPITWVNDEHSQVRASTYIEVLSEVCRVRWNLLRGVYGPRA